MPPFLADAIFWVAVVCSLVAQVAIVRAALGTHQGERQQPQRALATPRPRLGREVTWAVVPGVALAVVLYFTWRALHPLPPRAAAASAIEARSGGGARA